MTTQHPINAMLAQMPELANIFQWFLSGKHLNRIAHPALWAELEKQEAGYTNLFAALGFELRVDARGFAWFHSKEASSTISKTSRQLALLFMVIFDAQANAGKTLQRFTDWLFDRAWLVEAYKQQQDLLDAEGLTPDKLIETLDQACSRGFASAEAAGWRLLPAVCRYLDHFESLALATKEGSEETVAAATAESKNAPDWLGDEEMD